MKSYSGNTTNKMLLFAVAILIVIRVVLSSLGEYEFTDYDSLIIGMFPMIAVAQFFKIGGRAFQQLRDYALYILFGASISFLIGEALGHPKEIHLMEWFWLVFAVLLGFFLFMKTKLKK